ncbi:MAG: NUDIX hydrolase [Proteobacteria bacterium]|nr:NUDIX hydrolase [Pseudomonadota bacterium]MDA0868509.1 NUDIX hydrolase [Pseudomonadota bacterium]MDA1328088.1 NUDIX hydrolase [Pseudomonadota bacterium]
MPAMGATRWSPSVTVAAVMARDDGRYLLIEEHTPEGLRLNNPAGHLEPGETPAQGCTREAQEESAYAFTPTALVGVYLARFVRQLPHQAAQDITYVRFAFDGQVGAHNPQQALDEGIVASHWMTLDEVRASAARHRSPLVLRCIEDHANGQRLPLAAVSVDPSVWQLGALR